MRDRSAPSHLGHDTRTTRGSRASAASSAGRRSTSCRSCSTSSVGEMSFVGPRPEVPGFADLLTGEDALHPDHPAGDHGSRDPPFPQRGRAAPGDRRPGGLQRHRPVSDKGPDEPRVHPRLQPQGGPRDDLEDDPVTGLTTQLEPLAVAGGPRVRTAPLPPWPHYDDDHVDAATRILRSGQVNYWTGDEVPPVRGRVRRVPRDRARGRAGQRHARARPRAADPRHRRRATRSSSRPAPSSPRPAASCCAGATPVFADVDRDEPGHHRATRSRACSRRGRRRSLSSTSPAGRATWTGDHAARPRARLQGHRGLRPGARRAVSTGSSSGRFGDVGAFSFCQDKIITTGGEGGMLLTDDRDALVGRLVVQGPRQELGRASTPTTIRPASAGCTRASAPTGG